ncbi:MAG: hypothetical protein AB8F74_14660 [Saprospiraceae bacterium]
MVLSTYHFKQHCILLPALIENIQETQIVLVEVLKTLKTFGIPYTKNPLLKVQNELFELEYHLGQHIINCTVYQNIMDNGVAVDSNFIQELQGMTIIGGDFFNRSKSAHKELKKLYGNVNELLQPSQFTLKNILQKAPITLTNFLEKKKPVAAI